MKKTRRTKLKLDRETLRRLPTLEDRQLHPVAGRRHCSDDCQLDYFTLCCSDPC